MKPHLFKTRDHWAVKYEPYPPLMGWGTPNVAVMHMGNFESACAYAYLRHREHSQQQMQAIHHKEAL